MKNTKKPTLSIQGQHDVILATLTTALSNAAAKILLNGVLHEGTTYFVTTPHIHAAALQFVQRAFEIHNNVIAHNDVIAEDEVAF